MGRKFWYLPGLILMVLLSSCGTAQQTSKMTPKQPISSDGVSISVQQRPTPTPELVLSRQMVTPTPNPQPTRTTTVPTTSSNVTVPTSGPGSAPYGQPPAPTAEEIQLTQQLFALINHDRAVRGLYPFIWNNTLAGGARLHSWNMIHCGFSHTACDGTPQCTRIANEGFAGFTDCGECIGEAGPYPTAYQGMYNIQESMINEPPTGWHRIHLTSTTLHSIGVGIVVASDGSIWFTEDMVSQS